MPAAPAFGDRSVAEVLTSAAASLDVPGFENRLNLPASRRVCVVLADGLGRNLLKQKSAHTPFLRSVMQSGQGRVPVSLDSAFPSTTAASLASFGTGLAAGQHGMVGYDVLDPDQDRVVNMLGGWDAGVDPQVWQPFPTVFERAAEHVDVVTVSLPQFGDSAMTRAALREQFAAFFARPDSFSLGVCNGCQMLAQLKDLVPGAEHWPRFVRNESEQYEARLAQVRIEDSPSVLLAGMVGDVRIQQTRRWRMAIVKIEDGSAQLEVTLFNELYEVSRPWIRDGELLVVQGKATLDDYSGNMRVTADEVMDMASARAAFARRLDLGCAEQNASIVATLKELFTPYRGGKCPVVIHYRNQTGSAQLRLGEAWNVTLPDGLLNELRSLLGERNVRVVYG